MVIINKLIARCNYVSRRAVASRKVKKQHVHASSGLRDHYSELFTWIAGLN